MGGTNDPDNMTGEITVQEHAELHRQLWEDLDHWQDKVAWLALSGTIGQEQIISMKISESNKNRIYSSAERIKRSLNLKGKPKSTETKKKMSISAKKRANSEEGRARLKSIAHLGGLGRETQIMTEDQKENLSKKAKERWVNGVYKNTGKYKRSNKLKESHSEKMKKSWTEERRKEHSKKMTEFWRRKNVE